jgi:hypothetical protein
VHSCKECGTINELAVAQVSGTSLTYLVTRALNSEQAETEFRASRRMADTAKALERSRIGNNDGA